MPVFTDFPSVDSCLRCQGEERCPWHSDVRHGKESSTNPDGPTGDLVEHVDENLPRIVANLPPELFYNYNPSGPSMPSFRVLPTPTKKIWEEGIMKRLSLDLNPQLKKAFDEMRIGGKLGPVKFPSMSHFRFDNYHVRYIEPKPKLEWRLYRPENAPRPRECGKALCNMNAGDATPTSSLT